MPRILFPLLALILFSVSSQSFAQQFNSFRSIGEASSVASGAVTSVDLQSIEDGNSTLSFFDVAGLSTVYNIRLSSSDAISATVPVFMPPSDFTAVADLNLSTVGFYTGRLIHPDNNDITPPVHWFRLTLHEGIWSGTFRVAEHVYSINRLGDDTVVEVRSASAQTNFQPSKQLKITALIDNNYVSGFAGAQGNGHINALESLHVMDGLAADSLGIALKIEQVIYRPANELTSNGTSEWLSNNAEAFGFDDNFATFVFRGGVTARIGDNHVEQGAPVAYQFDSAFYLGQLFSLPMQSNTLSGFDQQASTSTALWNASQKDYLDNNPPPASLTQILSFDEPEIETPAPQENAPIPEFLVDAESEESSNGIGLQSDMITTTNTINDPTAVGGSSGGGTMKPVELLLLMFSCFALISFRKQRIKKTVA